MVKDWNQNFLVAYIEVRVACRQPFFFVADNFGHGQLDNIEFSAILVDGIGKECHSFLLGHRSLRRFDRLDKRKRWLTD